MWCIKQFCGGLSHVDYFCIYRNGHILLYKMMLKMMRGTSSKRASIDNVNENAIEGAPP